MKVVSVVLVLFISGSAYAQNKYSITVNLDDQTVEVYQNGLQYKKLNCSTGIKPGSTPTGNFETYSRKETDIWVEEDGTEIKYYYITRFNNGVAFHSQIEGDHPLVAEGKKLFDERKPSSMGCVRLSKQDAKWLYDLPLGISVHVIDGGQNHVKG